MIFYLASWLQHIPADFYKQLPRCRSLKHNHVDMVMEDENKKQFKIRLVYTGKDNEEIKPTLSGGWKKFVVAHKLVEGDVLIFQFVETRKFKVYIVKKDLEEDVGSHGEDMSPGLLKIINTTRGVFFCSSLLNRSILVMLDD
ncbi:putative transcription factor B3-Domain family [Helianthus annuus]|uniref:Transcription factor B3-Domain family n=1 Tax=Helianthus annuus TaxID=4232 RepID=A0A9K3I6N0_HELAN|nr:putative transcription factor B3-Domain family [Helianthus annuus]KAJ0542650.1 putative transcription factor B3-Domain family [Helianthus annuus]KAJ0893409.1 putative transcription factor B3-Domain family [Helianthus annuus]